MNYNLEYRTKNFSKSMIICLSGVLLNYHNKNIISQILRSATSVGANYCEANNAVSKNDFKNKIYICRKEIQETKYWLELLALTNREKLNDLRRLWKEAHELSLIFNKISFSLKSKK